MAPRSFSEDGAAGAGSWGGSGAIGTDPGGVQMHDPGPMGGAIGTDPGGVQMHDPGPVSLTSGGSGFGPFSGGDPGPVRANDPGPVNSNTPFSMWHASPMAGAPGASSTPSPTGLSFEGITNNAVSYSRGGAIEDNTNGSPDQDAIQRALQSIDGVLAFGRKLHGLGGNEEDNGAVKGAQTAMNTAGFRQSDDIEDRRGDTPPTAGPQTGSMMVGQATADPSRTKFDDVVDRVKDFSAGYNPMSQSAGINDVSLQPPQKGAVDTDEEPQ